MKLTPFQTSTLTNPTALLARLNDIVKAIGQSGPRVLAQKFGQVQSGRDVVLRNPGFAVGAVVLGGVNPVGGSAVPTSAPWVSNVTTQVDGTITLRVNGLAAFPAVYAVTLVLIEDEEASR